MRFVDVKLDYLQMVVDESGKNYPTLRKVKDTNIYDTVVLMLIYSGCRISELLDLKKENVYLKGRCFKIVEAKTAAGIRTVPIAEKYTPSLNIGTI